MIAIIVIIIAVAAYPAYVEAGILTRPQHTLCSTCNIQQPPLDVIIPKLFSSNVNSILNVTAGNVTTFEVDIYSTVAANISMRLYLDTVPGGSSVAGAPISATFSPEQLAVQTNIKAVTSMTLTISQQAQKGIYSISVSAMDDANASWIWGDPVYVNVTT